MSITFVSSFLHGSNPKRSYDAYKGYFDILVNTGIPIVLFLDRRSIWTFPENVKVIRISIEDTWVGQNVPDDVVLPTIRNNVDTLEYMKIINSKTEFVFHASNLNLFQTKWFAWIDFGIAHVFQKHDTIDRIRTLRPPETPCIRNSGIWTDAPSNLFDRICWRYAGGFFISHISCISRFHYAVLESIRNNLPNFAWEVNIWAEVERSGCDLGWFLSSHDDSIIPFNRNDTISTMDPEYNEPAGKQHYRFLEDISMKFSNSILFDIGTHKGMSAFALSTNPTNTVKSFDIVVKSDLPKRSNVEYHTDDLLTDEGREKWKNELLNSPFIFMDIDPHEGAREYRFYEWLRDNDYRGFMICDDIWYFKEMRDNFWYKIPTEHKIDVTDRGHISGTGIVRFTPSTLWPATQTPSNWTVVTAYFDLTKMKDASQAINDRPVQHYLASANTTMSLDQNLVVFCEPETVEILTKMRPAHLATKTKYITMSFEDFPLTQHRDKILENRLAIPNPDSRNTASYYLLCMARYAMLKRVIEENPFGSTHFAWLNICIERMGWKNAQFLDRIFQINRDKFSTCYIDYQPQNNYLENTMRNGRCSMCSGFFTGSAHYMKEFCDRIESKFVECLQKGYGHADEQLFSLVYFDDPSIFDVYYGDYNEMITNYEWIREHPSKPLCLLIKHSYDSGDKATCLKGCLALWRSWKKGYAHLSETEVTHLIWYYERCLSLPRELE